MSHIIRQRYNLKLAGSIIELLLDSAQPALKGLKCPHHGTAIEHYINTPQRVSWSAVALPS